MGRREELLAAVREHASPLGPFGDPDERDRLEREWEGTLSEGDCVELLTWVRESFQPSNSDYWQRRYAEQIATHVGRAGRRCRGPGLLRCVLDLLCDPQRRQLAFDAACSLDGSGRYGDLLIGEAAEVVPISAELASVAAPQQVEHLGRVAESMGCPVDVRLAIRDILRAATQAARHAEPGAAADGGA